MTYMPTFVFSMRIIMKRIILQILLSGLISLNLSAETPKDSALIHLIGVDIKPAYVFPSHPFFKGENLAQKSLNSTLSGHLKYGFKFSPATKTGQLYPHAIQGIGIGYNTFFNGNEVGNPLALYVFQSSRIANLTQRVSLDYEWDFGASFGWKKYDMSANPKNTVVGSKVNAYIHLGFLFNWEVAPKTHLRAGIGITHFSNGNTSYPNAGVNTLAASVGITRYFGRDEFPTKGSNLPPKPLFHPHVTYDLVVYGALKKKGVLPEEPNPILVPGTFGVLGLNINPLYNFNRYFRAGVSLDIQYDESANIGRHIANDFIPSDPEEVRFYRPPFKEQFSAGLSVRAEFVMPIFSINVGIGRNILCKGKDTNGFYQTFVLKTNLTKNIFLHTGYQLYRFKDPNHLMLGVGYRFNAQ